MRTRNVVAAFALLLLTVTVAPAALAAEARVTEGNRIGRVFEFLLDVLGLGEEPPNEIGPEINPVG